MKFYFAKFYYIYLLSFLMHEKSSKLRQIGQFYKVPNKYNIIKYINWLIKPKFYVKSDFINAINLMTFSSIPIFLTKLADIHRTEQEKVSR